MAMLGSDRITEAAVREKGAQGMDFTAPTVVAAVVAVVCLGAIIFIMVKVFRDR